MKSRIASTVHIILLFFVATSNAQNLSVLSVEDDSRNNLYLEVVGDKKDLDSITYLVGVDINIRNELIVLFRDFADAIGQKHGATLIPKTITNKNNNSNKYLLFSVAIDFINSSSCNFPTSDKSYVIFEDIKEKRCFTFELDNDLDLLVVLRDIHGHITNAEGIGKEKLRYELEKIINKYAIDGVRTELKSLVNYLLSYY